MIRKIDLTVSSESVIEGAGVKLQRVFGYPRRGVFDPFLLLDHFGSDNPADYLAGFPYHPHRGIETVTYILSGKFEHADSLGNKGIIESGGIQWMTAGSGIIHQEMPLETDVPLNGFQLWVNLPAANKMMSPRYQDIPAAQIKEIDWQGCRVRIAAGAFESVTGPVKDIVAQPNFWDFTVPPQTQQTIRVPVDHTVIIYVYQGSGFFSPGMDKPVKKGTVAKLVNGDQVFFGSGEEETRFILLTGKPLNEPIEWRGPIVMNTKEDLYQAFDDYHSGNFLNH